MQGGVSITVFELGCGHVVRAMHGCPLEAEPSPWV